MALVAVVSWPAVGADLETHGLGLPVLVLLYLAWGGLVGAALGALGPRLKTVEDRAGVGALAGIATYVAVAFLLRSNLVATVVSGVLGAAIGAFVGATVASDDHPA